VRSALAANNYAAFFRLYRGAPNAGRALMDAAVERMRFSAASVVARAYRPAVPLAALVSALGFDTPAEEADAPAADADAAAGADAAAPVASVAPEVALAALREWLLAHGASVAGAAGSEEEAMECGAAAASALFVPPPENAVAHGDADLDVSDFLKSWAPPATA
jgi:hypothetical protein